MAALLAAPLMALSPRLPQPTELAGRWILRTGDASSCRLRLQLTAAGAGRLTLPKACKLPGVDARAIAGWRPTTDGMSWVTSDGSLVLFLDRIAPDTYRASLTGGVELSLSRDPRKT